jgi:fatty-acid peroxygenase
MMEAQNIPRDPALDSTFALLREGYDFIANRCRRLHSDAFRTRVMGLPTVCIHGREAAELFYDESKLQRAHALPRRVVTTLFGKHAVHTLDDAAHRARKSAFLSLMSPRSLALLNERMAQEWRLAIRRWEQLPELVLFDEAQQVLARGVCGWAGVPLPEHEVAARTRDLATLVDAFGGVGPRLWAGKLARVRLQLWLGKLIHDVRRGALRPRPGSALFVMADHREPDGKPLDLRTAAVELLNVIRPTVAISWYVSFAALALHEHPEARAQLQREAFGESAGAYTDCFMQETRRFYPFTPFLGAMVRRSFHWHGHDFVPGTLVLLDVHGTNHDPALWESPLEFRPDRFKHWREDAFSFIPQGGGNPLTGHRCPGEWLTMHNLALALHFLTRCMEYEVIADQDLRVDPSRMPTRPKSGFRIRRVRATQLLDAPAPTLPSLAATRGERGALHPDPVHSLSN